jgi:hypothetical protein
MSQVVVVLELLAMAVMLQQTLAEMVVLVQQLMDTDMVLAVVVARLEPHKVHMVHQHQDTDSVETVTLLPLLELLV